MGRAFEYRKAAKLKRWGNMSRMFPKLQKAITIAAKSGGPDPDLNPALRTAIATAKAQNLPKKNIENAIAKAVGKDADNLNEITYEAKWKHGVLLVIECVTDNSTRTVANIKAALNKANASLVPNGSLEYMFSKKAVFELEKAPNNFDLEELELELIDFGLEELKIQEDNSIELIADYVDFGTLSKKLEELQIAYEKGSIQRIPNSPVEIDDESMAELSKLLDKLEDDEDVQNVYTNLA
jgi:YebC/PmpR family DNA-binding regulatory protein